MIFICLPKKTLASGAQYERFPLPSSCHALRSVSSEIKAATWHPMAVKLGDHSCCYWSSSCWLQNMGNHRKKKSAPAWMFILSKKKVGWPSSVASCAKKRCKLEKVNQKKSSHVPIAICSDRFTRFTRFVLDWKLLELEPSKVLMVDSINGGNPANHFIGAASMIGQTSQPQLLGSSINSSSSRRLMWHSSENELEWCSMMFPH